MRWMRSLSIALALAVCMAAAGPARASVVLKMAIEDLVAFADEVVHGDVVSLAYRSRSTSGKLDLATDVTLRVKEMWKGASASSTVVVTLPGGRQGDLVQKVVGAPELAVGEEVVLFLERTLTGHVVSGLQQGKFRVVREPFSGTPFAYRHFSPDLEIARRSPSGHVVLPTEKGSPFDAFRLSTLRARVRAAADAPAPK